MCLCNDSMCKPSYQHPGAYIQSVSQHLAMHCKSSDTQHWRHQEPTLLSCHESCSGLYMRSDVAAFSCSRHITCQCLHLVVSSRQSLWLHVVGKGRHA